MELLLALARAVMADLGLLPAAALAPRSARTNLIGFLPALAPRSARANWGLLPELVGELGPFSLLLNHVRARKGTA